MPTIKKGEQFTLKAEYRDAGENGRYTAADDEAKGRVLAYATDSQLQFPPINIIQSYMIQR